MRWQQLLIEAQGLETDTALKTLVSAVTPSLPGSDLLKSRKTLLINWTMRNRECSPSSAVCKLIEKKVRKSYMQDSHLEAPSFLLPRKLVRDEGCSIPDLLLTCSVRAGTSQNSHCFSFSIFAVDAATGIQLGKALWDLMMRSLQDRYFNFY